MLRKAYSSRVRVSRASIPLLLTLLGGCEQQGEALLPSRVLPYSHSGVPWIFDDGYQYLIDTGTPKSFVVPPVAMENDDAFVVSTIGEWNVLGMGEHSEVVITYDLPPAIIPMIGVDFGGILGADILSDRPFMLDPRRERFIVDDDGDFAEWLVETDGMVRVGASVTGGGTSCMREGRCFEHDGLRMLIDIEVEGQTTTALLDTASTYTTMGRRLYERLDEGGEPRTQVSIARGWDEWSFVRVGEIDVGGAQLLDVPVRVNPAVDTALARLSVETGQRVEMLLGHSFLLHFMAGVDYASATLTLAPYADELPVETEMFESFGLWLANLGPEYNCLRVVALAHGTDAQAAEIDVGDCIVELDGLAASELSDTALTIRMQGSELGDELDVAVVDSPGEGARVSQPRMVTLEKIDLLPKD